MKITRPFESNIDDFKEIHIDIEDVHFTLFADKGIDILGYQQRKNVPPIHFHSFYELFYLSNGSFRINFEQNFVDLKKDELILLAPKIAHSSFLDGEDSSRYCINFSFEKNNLKTEFSLYNILAQRLPTEYLYSKNGISVYESIKKIVENVTCDNHLKISFYFHQFILNLLNLAGYLTSVTPEEVLLDTSVSRTYKIQRIITAYYMEDISLEFIAMHLHLSTRQLNRIVQDFYGCTYREIITRTRLKSAANLLETGTSTVSEISTQVGYRSLRGFYSAFKKYYGCLPTEYRKKVNE